MRSRLVFAIGFLCIPRVLGSSNSSDSNVTAEDFCQDNKYNDEATCTAAHVLVPNDISPEYYGSPREVKCCKWEDNRCTYGTINSNDKCDLGIEYSSDNLFHIYTTHYALATDQGKDQRVATQVVLRIVGFASFVGSIYIIYSLAGSRAKCQKHLRQQSRSNMNVVFNRMFLVLSIGDALASFMFFLASWMIPKYEAWEPGVVEPFSEELYYDLFPWASGAIGSCRFQGSFLWFWQIISISLTGAISLQYVLTVVLKWKEAKMIIFERAMYAWSIVISLVTVVIALAKDAVGPTVAGFCWISSNPWYCNECIDCSSPPYPYQGCNSESVVTDWNLRYFVMAIIGSNLVVVIISMSLLFHFVSNQEQRAARWSTNAGERRASKKVVYKALTLIGVYLVVYFPAIAAMFFSSPSRFIVNAIFLPCQGFFNALIFSDKLTKAVYRRSSASSRSSITGTVRHLSRRLFSRVERVPANEKTSSSLGSTSCRNSTNSGGKISLVAIFGSSFKESGRGDGDPCDSDVDEEMFPGMGNETANSDGNLRRGGDPELSGKSNSSRHNSSSDLWSSQNHRQSATGASELLKSPKTSSMIVENSQIENSQIEE